MQFPVPRRERAADRQSKGKNNTDSPMGQQDDKRVQYPFNFQYVHVDDWQKAYYDGGLLEANDHKEPGRAKARPSEEKARCVNKRVVASITGGQIAHRRMTNNPTRHSLPSRHEVPLQSNYHVASASADSSRKSLRYYVPSRDVIPLQSKYNVVSTGKRRSTQCPSDTHRHTQESYT